MAYAIVTGAAGGIGQALVREFTAAGHDVIGVDVVGCPKDLPCAGYLICDLNLLVLDQAYGEEMFQTVRRMVSDQPLLALINNAAVQILGPIESLTREEWHETLNTNLLAPFLWAQALLPELEAGNGCVLNISSIHARLTKSSFCAYATSKAALSGLTRQMAVELGGRIRVNAIEPAAINTPMLKAGFEGNVNGFARLKEYHPTGEIGSAEDLAKLAAAVIAAPGDFLNGAVIAYDGGIGSVLHDPD